jgi:hypothetical protein
MSYYRDTNDMRGRNLTKGGPERPDTSGMTKASTDAEIKKWRKARKKYADGLLAAKAKMRNSLEEPDEYDDAVVPIKSKMLVPLLKEAIAARPNMSHKECAQLLHLHVHQDFLTAMIVQNAKMQCRFELFGNPTMNAQYTTAMLRESSIRGHKVKGVYKTAEDVIWRAHTTILWRSLLFDELFK